MMAMYSSTAMNGITATPAPMSDKASIHTCMMVMLSHLYDCDVVTCMMSSTAMNGITATPAPMSDRASIHTCVYDHDVVTCMMAMLSSTAMNGITATPPPMSDIASRNVRVRLSICG